MDRFAEEEGGECDSHGETGRRAVFGDGTGGDVDVEVVFLENLGVNLPLFGVGPDVAEGGLGAFAHDVAKGAGEGDGAFAGHHGGFDEEDVAAGAGPCEAGADAGFGAAFDHVGEVFGRAEEIFQVLAGNDDAGGAALDEAAGGASAGDGNGAFEVADAGFTGVLADHAGEGIFLDDELVAFEAVLGELAWDEVLGGDVDFFLLGVAGEVDDLHAVAERGRDRFELVRGGDEHDP